MTTATKSERERGTPLQNPFKHPRILSCVAVVICAALSVLACGTDLSNRKMLLATSVGAALGSLSAVIAIVESCDSSTHALAFGVAVIISMGVRFMMETDDLEKASTSALLVAAGPLFVGVTSKVPPIRKLLRIVASTALLNTFIISAIAFIPLLSIVAGSILLILTSEEVNLPFPRAVPTWLGISTFVVLWLYFHNKSHKNGDLLSTDMKGTAVVTACSIAYTVHTAISIPSAPSALLPVLLGSLLSTLLGAVFCAVADSWYTVGTGQFLMVSLDTAGLLLYFVSPIVVLLVRFINQYGEGLHKQLESLVQTLLNERIPTDMDYSIEDQITSGVLFFVAAGTMLGVPLVNALCPLGAHLFGFAYTHGQPNTRRVGLCIDMKDFVQKQHSSGQQENGLQSLCDKMAVKDKKSVAIALNIFVTLDDLTRYPDVVKSCSREGHAIGISCSSASNALETFEEFTKVLTVKPTWCRLESRDASVVAQVAKLGMKIAFWSTHVSVTSMDAFESKEMDKIRLDVLDKKGGSFIFLENESGDTTVMSQAVCHVVEDLSVKDEHDENGFKFLPLSLVAQEYQHMDL